MMEPATAEKQPVVLVVDDEPSILSNLELLLMSRGCAVLTAATGEEGVRIAISERPDVILLDLMLPDVDGYEVCRRIKQEPSMRHVPVLMLTAVNDVMSKVKGLDAGADDFIAKPFNEGELRARLRAFLRTKRLHDELDDSYRRLKELEDLRDSLTHMIMHDLVAPLTAIQIGVEAVLDKVAKKSPLADVHERMLKNAHDGCRRLMDMLRDVLSVSRLEENKLPLSREKIDLPALVKNCTALLEPMRELNGVTIRTDIPAGLPPISADASLLGRVIVNLIVNSLKFTEKEGTVNVSAAAKEGGVEISVSDSGLGIAPEDLERIFSKFYQGGTEHSARKGQGLGLAFCRLAVEAHGGRIWAESEPGKGSRFVLRLPAFGS